LSSRISKYPGVEITSDDVKAEKYLVNAYRTRLGYAWTSGVAMGRYLQGLRDGQIWGRHCPRCDRVLIPPRMYCERCYSTTETWVRVRDTGRVVTYSIAYVNFDASRRMEPILVAIIELDGASPMTGILHLLGDVGPQAVKVGLAVKAVWKDAHKRSGAITDIRHFAPMRGGVA
jgi:uncharacterized protein